MFKNKKIAAAIPAVIALVICAAVLTVCIVLPYDKLAADPTNSFNNLANGGFIAEDGSLTYYVTSNGQLRCKTAQNDYRIDDGPCSYVSPFGNSVIYISGGAVMRSAFNGNGDSVRLIEHADSIIVSGNWIYWSDGGAIGKMRVDGGTPVDLGITEHGQFIVTGSYIFYIDANGYLRTALTDGSGDSAFYAEKTERFIVSDYYIFYIADGVVKSVESSNTAKKVTYFEADEFCICGDFLVYLRGSKLYWCDYTADELSEHEGSVQGENPTGLCVSDGCIFYYNDTGELIRAQHDGSSWEVFD